MKVFSTATNIGQAFKNAGRVKEILSVFVGHGFVDLLHRMRLSRFLPSKYSENPRFKNLPMEVRLRLALEELGPTFVKLGQLLATRPDLIPESYVEEFQKLQDRVATVPFKDIKQFVEAELRTTLTEIFSDFEEKPLAAASIAQVHGAQLKSGKRVAVKVQRPGIEKIIQNDISIMRGLAYLMETYIPESQILNPAGLVEEFFKTILYELDFMVEANNIRRIKANMASSPKVAVPEVYSTYSTNHILVLERFDGIRFSDRAAILQAGIRPEEIVETGCDAFFRMVMQDGIFHGDLHAGNLFVLPDGRIGIIDFGIVGRLGKRVRDSIVTMFTALIDEDFETLAAEYINMCQATDNIDVQALQKDLMDTISPYIGMSLGEVNVGKVLMRSTAIATRHHLQVPRELMLLFKAIITIEALGKKLDPTFDMLTVSSRLARQTLQTRYSKDRIMRDLLIVGRDLQEVLETSPRLIKRFLRKWSQNNFAIETRSKSVEALAVSVRAFTHFFLLAVLSTGLFAVGITFLISHQGPTVGGVPVWGFLPSLIAFFVLVYGLRATRKGIR